MYRKTIKAGVLFIRRQKFKVCTGPHCLGGCIGDDVSKGDWLKKRTDKWERYIRALSKTVDKYPHKSYAAVARTVQMEWIFMQRVTKYTGQVFTGMEKFLLVTFLPRLSLENRKPSLQL